MEKIDSNACAYCATQLNKSLNEINRAKKYGRPLFCNKTCFGLSRRKNKTVEQKKEQKRLYDAKRRIQLADEIKAAKKAYFKRTYDPVKAAIKRKGGMPNHVEYCRRPEYKKYKKQYDQQHRAKRNYGEFYEAFLILLQIDREVEAQASRYEIGLTNGTINKAQKRRRTYERTYSDQS